MNIDHFHSFLFSMKLYILKLPTSQLNVKNVKNVKEGEKSGGSGGKRSIRLKGEIK